MPIPPAGSPEVLAADKRMAHRSSGLKGKVCKDTAKNINLFRKHCRRSYFQNALQHHAVLYCKISGLNIITSLTSSEEKEIIITILHVMSKDSIAVRSEV
ncbi:hypothetical protein CHARACLAT_027261 [Characodon lateralis]|uniref:Uncharacterized protein n=1 Tax=Characodon lateralis TaxID=208331 RepID=A0ABU7DW69_9TELE|nr:hypothetical protein [Characodon lateralis]